MRRSTKLPITKWSKHGSTIVALSERDFIKDLSIAMDVATNPRPNYIIYTPTALLRTSRASFSYSRHNLFQLRSCCIHCLKSLGIYRARGCRTGANSRFKSRQQLHKILVRVTGRYHTSTTRRTRLCTKDTNLHFISITSNNPQMFGHKCKIYCYS